ncbi:MAG: hypothetical protein C4297_09045 [Gemmataceae bacterium]
MDQIHRLAVVLTTGLVALAGCERPPTISGAEAAGGSQLLHSALKALEEVQPRLSTYKEAILQLNQYLAQHRNESDLGKLDADERILIEKEILGPLLREDRERHLSELERERFTLLDAYHLDGCYLFRDASQSLVRMAGGAIGRSRPAVEQQAQALELARLAFDWAMRQVALAPDPPGTDPWPAVEVLRRGTGSAPDRARVFVALLEQLHIPACLVGQEAPGQHVDTERLALVGTLIGDDIYLFDCASTRPAQDARGQLRTLRQSSTGQDQGTRTVLYLPCTLAALAPRMKWLEGQLAEDSRPRLYVSLKALKQQFERHGVVRIQTSRRGYPATILARYVENPLRQLRWEDNPQIIPLRAIPDWAKAYISKLGPVHALPMVQPFVNLFLLVRTEPGGPRDLLVRGRPEQAVERIVVLDQRLDQALDIFHRDFPGEFENFRDRWLPLLVKEYDKLQELSQQRDRARNDPGRWRILEEEIGKQARSIEGIWKERSVVITYMCYDWAAEEVREHLYYFAGLAKMDLATRAELLAQRSARAGRPVVEQERHWREAVVQWEAARLWLDRARAIASTRPVHNWFDAASLQRQVCQDHLEQCQRALAQLRPGSASSSSH